MLPLVVALAAVVPDHGLLDLPGLRLVCAAERGDRTGILPQQRVQSVLKDAALLLVEGADQALREPPRPVFRQLPGA